MLDVFILFSQKETPVDAYEINTLRRLFYTSLLFVVPIVLIKLVLMNISFVRRMLTAELHNVKVGSSLCLLS